MNDDEIQTLNNELSYGMVLWVAYGESHEVDRVSGCAEEGKDDDGVPYPCAILEGGGYVALHNCELNQFYSAKSLSLGGTRGTTKIGLRCLPQTTGSEPPK